MIDGKNHEGSMPISQSNTGGLCIGAVKGGCQGIAAQGMCVCHQGRN